MRVQFCSDCGRVIDFDFHFCPWCGTATHEIDKAHVPIKITVIDEKKITGSIERKIAKLEGELDSIEKDLDFILDKAIDHT